MEILSLCKTFPVSTQVEAFLFFMKYYGLSFEDDLNFFKTYYEPTWSIIYWICKSFSSESALNQTDIKNARAAHSPNNRQVYLQNFANCLKMDSNSATSKVMLQRMVFRTNILLYLMFECHGPFLSQYDEHYGPATDANHVGEANKSAKLTDRKFTIGDLHNWISQRPYSDLEDNFHLHGHKMIHEGACMALKFWELNDTLYSRSIVVFKKVIDGVVLPWKESSVFPQQHP